MEDEKIRLLNEIVKRTGVDFVENTTDNTSKSIEYVGDYARDLNNNGMMTDEQFERANIDWGHIKKVMDVSDKKYGSVYKGVNKVTSEAKKKREKMEKIVDLMMEIMKDE